MSLKIQIPNKLIPLFKSDRRFISIYGGRGSGKSWGVALYILTRALQTKTRVLCCREVQKSIKDSVYKLFADLISSLELEAHFTVKHDSIVGSNGSDFIFKGLRHNAQEIKSTEGIDIAWIEEAQNVSRASLELLTPTVRKDGSQIIFTYNPTNEDDPVHVDYTKTERPDVLKIAINYSDNKFFPEVLKNELEYDKRVDFDKYLHKWEGKCVKHSEAQIFYGKWRIDDFETNADTFYYGADWGFSQDPTALVRCFILDNKLYIDQCAYGVGVDIDKTPELFDTVVDSRKWQITADSARPETISYMNRHGFRIKSSVKGSGSVADGIAYLRGFEEIIIHSRCRAVIDEFSNYCWKTDRITGNILPVPEDKHNHCIDALRYALEDLMRHRQGRVIQRTGW